MKVDALDDRALEESRDLLLDGHAPSMLPVSLGWQATMGARTLDGRRGQRPEVYANGACSLLCLLSLVSSGCDEQRPRDPNDCRDWVEAVPDVPGRSLAPAPLVPGTPSACLTGASIHVGRRRVAFSPARAGEGLSAELLAALPASDGARTVDLWAPASARAHDVVLVARAFGRAGVRVSLVGRREGQPFAITRIEPPRRDAIPPAGIVPVEVDAWVEMTPERFVVAATDGTVHPIAEARWEELAERLRERRAAYEERRITFAPRGALPYRDLARAMEIAARAGYDAIELTPVGALAGLELEVQWELARRQGGLPELPREEIAAPPECAPGARPDVRSEVELEVMDVAGDLDASEVERVARARLSDLTSCHECALGADPALRGRVVLAFIVSPAGTVRPVRQAIASDVEQLRHAGLVACLRARIARWRFPRSRSGHGTGVLLPLALRPSPASAPR